jgi:hypothetical protein
MNNGYSITNVDDYGDEWSAYAETNTTIVDYNESSDNEYKDDESYAESIQSTISHDSNVSYEIDDDESVISAASIEDKRLYIDNINTVVSKKKRKQITQDCDRNRKHCTLPINPSLLLAIESFSDFKCWYESELGYNTKGKTRYQSNYNSESAFRYLMCVLCRYLTLVYNEDVTQGVITINNDNDVYKLMINAFYGKKFRINIRAFITCCVEKDDLAPGTVRNYLLLLNYAINFLKLCAGENLSDKRYLGLSDSMIIIADCRNKLGRAHNIRIKKMKSRANLIKSKHWPEDAKIETLQYHVISIKDKIKRINFNSTKAQSITESDYLYVVRYQY